MPSKIPKDTILYRLVEIFPEYKFDMSLYNNIYSKIKVTCPIHGDSYKITKNLLKGHGCLICGNKSSGDSQRLSKEDLLLTFDSKHGHKYDYSKFIYKNNKIPGIIICTKHGEFSQNYRTHFYLT
jgi:hypothetical protein